MKHRFMCHHFFFNTLACRNNCRMLCSASLYPAYFKLLRPMRTKSNPSRRSNWCRRQTSFIRRRQRLRSTAQPIFLPVTKPIRVGCFGERGRTYRTTRRLTYDLPRRYTSWYSRFLHSRCSLLVHTYANCPKNARKTEKFRQPELFCLSRNN